MARVRKPGSERSLPPTRGPEGSNLAALLTSRRFRLGGGAERVAQNLELHGGVVAPDAAAWVGAGLPPLDAPSIALGDGAGTLGPWSFGFLNNIGRVAALNAPLPMLPRQGSLALVVPSRDALPDLGPLLVERGLGVSWIVSVGAGDPAEALAFLAADPVTASLAVALGSGGRGSTLRRVLGAKPAVVWGGDVLCRAVARRVGAFVVDDLVAFIARAALLDAGVEPGARVRVVVVGGGGGYVAEEVKSAALAAEVVAVDERAGEELAAEIERAVREALPVVLVAGNPPPVASQASLDRNLKLIRCDLRHFEFLRALLAALAQPVESDAGRLTRPRIDRELLAKVKAEVEELLSDHDAKRLLKAYGARVTRQAPTGTPTGAVKLARAIGLPVLLVPSAEGLAASLEAPSSASEAKAVTTLPEVRRLASLLLQQDGSTNPSVMVRESFPDAPRARARIAAERELGLAMRVGEACALLPLTRSDALELAAATPARRAADQRAVAELLGRIATCAEAERATLDLEIYVGAEPAVLEASGTLRKS